MPAPLLTISKGDSLNAWELSPVDAKYFPGEPAIAHDKQNYRYVNGFVDVGETVANPVEAANAVRRMLTNDAE